MYYAACDKIGTGTISDPYRPVVADYQCDFIAIDRNNGCFVKFAGGDEAGAIADNRVAVFNQPLTDIVGSGQATFINGRLASRYSITSNPVVAGMTWAQAINAVLAAFDPTALFTSMQLHGSSY